MTDQRAKTGTRTALAKSRSLASRLSDSFLATPLPLYTLAILLRVVLLLYGLWQDANSPLKYTDIDYLVFTDAARFAAQGHSQGPYARETYRYTPLLAWMLLPTVVQGAGGSGSGSGSGSGADSSQMIIETAWFSSGKVLFAAADIVAGWLIVKVLTMDTTASGGTRKGGYTVMTAATARGYASIWLLNPMVATISTRGSSEGLLGVLVMALLWATLSKRISLAGLILGFSVHFKIYPFIYAPAIIWWMDNDRLGLTTTQAKSLSQKSAMGAITNFITPTRTRLTLVSLTTFIALNVAMYALYGYPFLVHTYLHHVTRIDHRHNFSPYNILLYLSSSPASPPGSFSIESVAFLPQLLLSCVLIPLVTAKRSLPGAMLAQTFAFVTFNKVCTSQYFLWYMVFLPLYLPYSSFIQQSGRKGLLALGLWIVSQAAWLQQGYGLEFLGQSTFVPGLWAASLVFFAVNCWILGVIVTDIAHIVA